MSLPESMMLETVINF